MNNFYFRIVSVKTLAWMKKHIVLLKIIDKKIKVKKCLVIALHYLKHVALSEVVFFLNVSSRITLDG